MPSTLPPFVAPSPGAWEIERTHFTKPVSRFMSVVFPPAMTKGFSEATKHYGALLDRIELATVNGFVYSAVRPVGAPPDANGPPPRALFWLLQRVHPELRARIKRADQVFREKSWRAELTWWDNDVKPDLARQGQALLAEDLSSYTDAELGDHMRRATAYLEKTAYSHHRMNACALVAPADFIAHVVEWTGEKPETVLIAMRGQSPLSTGPESELGSLRAAILGDPEAKAILQSSRPASEVLTALGQRPSVAAPLRQYLETAGWRVLGGYDVADKHGREHPELLVKIISTAVNSIRPEAAMRGQEAIAALRAKVPPQHQAQFDDLLVEAQLVYRVRDERNFCSDALGIGLARRALLAVGDRLKARGRIHDASHTVDATPGEIAAMMAGSAVPSADELAARVTYRETTSQDLAPEFLGNPPSPPPPADWLPGGAARLQRAITTSLALMFDVPKQAGSGQQLKGFGVSPGVVEGPARVILDITDLPTVRGGEILVTPSTGPTFNVVLPLLHGLVTERGGALSHAAIVAREYGIPGIVGCREITKRVTTGMRLRVDGTKGEVWILG